MSLQLKRETGDIVSGKSAYVVSLSYYNVADFDEESGFTDCSARIVIPKELGDGMTVKQLLDEALRRWDAMKHQL